MRRLYIMWQKIIELIVGIFYGIKIGDTVSHVNQFGHVSIYTVVDIESRLFRKELDIHYANWLDIGVELNRVPVTDHFPVNMGISAIHKCIHQN